MANEEFQKAVLEKLGELESDIIKIKESQNNTDNRLKNIESRQDEIYQVVRAMEHSNQVGRSELDNQNIRIAKLEGKFKIDNIETVLLLRQNTHKKKQRRFYRFHPHNPTTPTTTSSSTSNSAPAGAFLLPHR